MSTAVETPMKVLWEPRKPTHCPNCASTNPPFERFDKGGEEDSFFVRHEKAETTSDILIPHPILTGMVDAWECTLCGYVHLMTRKKVEVLATEVPG